MVSSVSPSARAARSPLLPPCLNGNTATQKPSSARAAPESGGATIRRRREWKQASDVTAWSRQIAKFVADVARCLQAVTRIFLQTAAHDAGQIAGQIGTHVGDGRRRIAQNRGDQLGRRISFERPPLRLPSRGAGRREKKYRCDGRADDPMSVPETCRPASPSPRPLPFGWLRSWWRRRGWTREYPWQGRSRAP